MFSLGLHSFSIKNQHLLAEGDVVTMTLDVILTPSIAVTLSYAVNGRDLGIAFGPKGSGSAFEYDNLEMIEDSIKSTFSTNLYETTFDHDRPKLKEYERTEENSTDTVVWASELSAQESTRGRPRHSLSNDVSTPARRPTGAGTFY